jgi:hypothetical protein
MKKNDVVFGHYKEANTPEGENVIGILTTKTTN